MTELSADGANALWVLLGVGLASFGGAYRLLQPVVTLIHECGHAFIAFLAGRRLAGIRVWRDTSGETLSIGRSSGLGVSLTLMAGYPAPGVLGVVLLAGHRGGVELGVCAVLSVLAAGALLLLRNAYAFAVALVLGLGVCIGAYYGGTQILGPAMVVAGSYLAVAGLRGSYEQTTLRGAQHDAASLARLTWLPDAAWKGFFFLVALMTVIAAGWIIRPWMSALWNALRTA